MPSRVSLSKAILCTIPLLAGAFVAHAQSEADLSELSLEELMDMEVYSVSKSEATLQRSAAAVYVLRGEDIRRGGHRSVPEALRMVPGLHVARLNAHGWSISSRGFSQRFSNKLLVLIDGRSIYTPVFSGVHWDEMDILIEDIDRIEVIRGPGASLWGANAVNGIINIITRDPDDAQGLHAEVGAGAVDEGLGAFRYGNRAEGGWRMRHWAKAQAMGTVNDVHGAQQDTHWGGGSGGSRLVRETEVDRWDIDLSASSRQFDLDMDVSTRNAPYTKHLGGTAQVVSAHSLLRYRRSLSGDSDLQLSAYWSRSRREELLYTEHTATYDLDLQHSFALGSRQRLNWGGGYRLADIQIGDGTQVEVLDPRETVGILNVYAQDRIDLIPDNLEFTLGSKLEHSERGGTELQPTLRLLYSPLRSTSLWAAASRAIRTPSISETSVSVHIETRAPSAETFGLPVWVDVLPASERQQVEEARTLEFGLRSQPHASLALEAALFATEYDHLQSYELLAPLPVLDPTNPHLEAGIEQAFEVYGHARGGELTLRYQPGASFRGSANYSYLELDLAAREGSSDVNHRNTEAATPRHQVQLHLGTDPAPNWRVDGFWYWYDESQDGAVDAFSRLDLRLAHLPRPSVELALSVQNLLDDENVEAEGTFFERISTFPRSLFVTLTVRQ